MSKLENQLLLFDFVTEFLGGDFKGLVVAMKSADLGTRADGQSCFFSVLESRGVQVKIDRSKLAEYDLNVLEYESVLGKQRPGFRFTYFQYLAAFYAEVFLSWFSADPAGLLKYVRAFQENHAYPIPSYEARDLTKLAFWMATGSGKTLITHVNLMQWERYQPFHADNVILITPNESLSQQHMEELALSGISSARADRAGVWADVQVIEITKLYVEGAGDGQRRGGVSMPVSMFEGRNLVLVDEGHKGSTSAADVKEERKWRGIREALTGDKGFTIEYSATFAQITENNEDLLREYSKAILVDYGYRRFWEDGYGKDYQVVNLKDEGAYDSDELLLAGLLNLYEQRRYFDDHPEEMQTYNIEAPLMVFVGAKVTAGGDSEVLEVLRFLDRVLTDPGWAIDRVGALLRGASGLPSDLFTHTYPYVGDLGLDGALAYADLTSRLFHGKGRLMLHHIRRADGEIGLRTADAERDRYCGVVNIGDSSAFFRLAIQAGLAEGEDDQIATSVFEAIDSVDSPVNLLVGSKKFIEGWSSWRVSVMGLLKVGRNAGPQVIQLFGRGVRLKGLGMQLRRSTAVAGDHHPARLPLVEKLHIFGVRADYMQSFNEAVRREGMPPPVARLLPIAVKKDIGSYGLRYPDSGDYDFGQEVVSFDPGALWGRKIEIDLVPRFTTAHGVETMAAAEGSEPAKTGALPVAKVDEESAFLHALEYKRRRRWPNVYVTRKAIHEFLSGHVRVRVPAFLFEGRTHRDRAILQSAALDAVEKGLERFAYAEQRTRETRHLATQVLAESHPNFPTPRTRDVDGSAAYVLAVPEPLLDAVDEIVSGLAEGSITAHDDMSEPLPRLSMDEHLYGPLLANEAEIAAAGPRDIFASHQGVRSTPAGLFEGEVTFLKDLRETWRLLSPGDEWVNHELHILRNLPKRGVGFFSTAGFYPDFLLWMKAGEAQVLTFVEPHGMVIWDPVKVELLKDIRKMDLDLPLLAFIVTATEPRSVGAIGGAHHKEEWFKERHILFQDGTGYVTTILAEMRTALDLVAEGVSVPVAATASTATTRHLSVVADSAEIESQKFETMLPVYSLEAAAGQFGAGETVEAEGWIEISDRNLSDDMFVARAVGHSMEPRIADGDLCIFRAYRGGTRRDRIMLFQWQGPGDPETGGSYAVKKYLREQEIVEGGELVGFRVTLTSLNPDYDPIVIEAEYEDEIVAIAEYVDSLGAAAPSSVEA